MIQIFRVVKRREECAVRSEKSANGCLQKRNIAPGEIGCCLPIALQPRAGEQRPSR